jgi:uncharacterized membrane protein
MTRATRPRPGHTQRRRTTPIVSPPVTASVLAVLVAAAFIVIGLLAFGALSYAYARIGISAEWMLVILAVALLGSLVNIPVATLPARIVACTVRVRVFGVVYRAPALVEQEAVVIAVNVGGAVVPTAVAVYLIVQDHVGTGAVLATLAVTGVTYAAARPIPGLGIVIPPLLAPATAAVMAVIVAGSAAAAVAFVAGTIGTLVGADLLNLRRVRSLGAPLVAIGGAGTFDGIFLVGVIAVLLATI